MRDELRVLFIDHSGAVGGGQLVLMDLTRLLPVRSEVVFLSPGPVVDRLASGVHAVAMEGGEALVSLGKETGTLSRLWASRRLPGMIRRLACAAKQAHVVYANSKKALLFAALAARKARRPLIWHQHDEMRLPRTLPLRARVSESLLVHLLNRYAARVISVSRASADTLVAAGGRTDLPVVIHNGLDPARYAQPVDRAALRRELGLPVDAPIVGCFGRLTEWKGQSVLIDALMHLPGAHAILVGGAIFGESGYEAALRAQAERLGLTPRVHFLGHREDVPALMQAVDVVAHTSTGFESFGLVIAEGIMSERPVVATAVGGVPELIEDGVSGLLIPPNDAIALSRALARILMDHDLSRCLAAAGRQRALRDFTLDQMVRGVERLIRAVANSTPTI
jgi:glycosyltransferase involved in cell wall biosynthesis